MSKWLTESRDRVGKKLSEASSKRVEQTKISTGKERRRRQDDESDDEQDCVASSRTIKRVKEKADNVRKREELASDERDEHDVESD